MAESDGELEYLEEDAEIVQQCVRSSLSIASPKALKVSQIKNEPHLPLLVERPKVQKKVRKTQEEDSEYDPNDDNLPPSPPSPPLRKRRVIRPLKRKINNVATNIPNLLKNKTILKDSNLSAKEQLLIRKKFSIRIPDYDDPLCLPVRAIKTEESDLKKLNNWNNVCLEHFKHCDSILKPENGDTKRSIRTAVFRNVINKQTGNTETTIWSKTCVENEDSDKKSEIFQCVLPRYKEKKVLGNYTLVSQRHRTTTLPIVDEVVLSKENHKDGDALVVYKPKESISAVYEMVDKRKKPEENEGPSHEEYSKMFLNELTACMVCAPCFQSSWRAQRKDKKKSMVCPICARPSVSVYNLLSHFKAHADADVLQYRNVISAILADIVDYHYKCRICRHQFDSIKALRRHVVDHQSKETFTCEVCNRVINK